MKTKSYSHDNMSASLKVQTNPFRRLKNAKQNENDTHEAVELRNLGPSETVDSFCISYCPWAHSGRDPSLLCSTSPAGCPCRSRDKNLCGRVPVITRLDNLPACSPRFKQTINKFQNATVVFQMFYTHLEIFLIRTRTYIQRWGCSG